jgi:CBS domain-containing protein
MPYRTVAEVLNARSFPTLNVDMNIKDASVIMKEWRNSAVLVIANGVISGILTERDVVFRVIASGLDPATTRVSDVMTRHVTCIQEDKPFGHALHMMYEGGFRHVPVINAQGKPVGIVTAQDALGLDSIQMMHELVQREEIAVIL